MVGNDSHHNMCLCRNPCKHNTLKKTTETLRPPIENVGIKMLECLAELLCLLMEKMFFFSPIKYLKLLHASKDQSGIYRAPTVFSINKEEEDKGEMNELDCGHVFL